MGFTKKNFDFDSAPWLTSLRQPLDLKGVALGLIRLPAGEGYTFLHAHREQEEVYMVIGGRGKIQIDEEILEICRGDFLRVDPSSKRALKADEEDLLVICAGGIPLEGWPKNSKARYMIDDGIPFYKEPPRWYEGNKEIALRNEELLQRFEKSKKKRTQ